MDDRTAQLDLEYKGWLAEHNLPMAAEVLNGFNRGDIEARIAHFTPDEVTALHEAALANERLGPQSQIALITGSAAASTGASHHSVGSVGETVRDIAVGKGLVIVGEQVGRHIGVDAAAKEMNGLLGGVIGWALDFAISPGGDSLVVHKEYSAALGEPDESNSVGLPLPGTGGGQWYRTPEEAGRDARAFTERTGEPAHVIWQFHNGDGYAVDSAKAASQPSSVQGAGPSAPQLNSPADAKLTDTQRGGDRTSDSHGQVLPLDSSHVTGGDSPNSTSTPPDANYHTSQANAVHVGDHHQTGDLQAQVVPLDSSGTIAGDSPNSTPADANYTDSHGNAIHASDHQSGDPHAHAYDASASYQYDHNATDPGHP
jgi:hypothetical protein